MDNSGCEFITVPFCSVWRKSVIRSLLYNLISGVGCRITVWSSSRKLRSFDQTRKIKTHHRLSESLGSAWMKNRQRQDIMQLIQILTKAINSNRPNSAILTRYSVKTIVCALQSSANSLQTRQHYSLLSLPKTSGIETTCYSTSWAREICLNSVQIWPMWIMISGWIWFTAAIFVSFVIIIRLGEEHHYTIRLNRSTWL